MKAVIMAGGFGTRLRPLTTNIPKPMIPMAVKPLMEHIVDLLKDHGLDDLITLLYFQPDTIERYFGDGREFGVKMVYATATEDYGTAGAVKNAAAFLDDTFLVISGDVLTDFDLSKAVKVHKDRGAMATMVLTRVENPLQYGVVITAPDGRITHFLEKPTWGEVISDTVNTGIYILEPEVLELIPAGKEFDFSRDLFPKLMHEGRPLYGHVAAGYWKDVGDLIEYRLAHRDILAGLVKVALPGTQVEGLDKPIWLGEGSRVDFTASLRDGVLIGRHTQVGPNTHITRSVIGDNCVIEEGAVIIGSVLWNNVFIGARAVLKENVVGRASEIKANARIFEGALISEQCKVGEGSVVKADVKVWPHKVVEDGAVLATSLIWGQKWSRALFGAYGVTGLANLEISPEFGAKLGACFGATLRMGSFVRTSRDGHQASHMVKRAVVSGLLSAGINVRDFRVAPIPVVRYKMSARDVVGAVHVRKSPFDSELIDIIFFDEYGMDISSSREKSIERLFFREDFRRAKVEEIGRLSPPPYGTDFYRDGILSFIDQDALRRCGFRIVVDYAYGSSSVVFPQILGTLGCEVIALNGCMDESRITKSAEEFRRSLHQLSGIVKSLRADLGIMLDAGGEKIFIVDDAGNLLSDDLALATMALLVMRTHPHGVIGIPITAGSVIEELARDLGFEVLRTKTAPRALTEAATQEGVIFVGDGLGGFIFPKFQPAFDGMLAILKLLEMLATQDLRLRQFIPSVPQRFKCREQVPCSWERKGGAMRALIAATADEQVELVDGVKVHLGRDWVILYPDQDRPMFHILAEADTLAQAEAHVARYRAFLDDCMKGSLAEAAL
ncbi:nucleotidyltransferase [Candidatus Methylomirabilis lanthanidiphila]|uniref:Nucleotidyltransferase n=1 Tax=Candidatus Methylomirabilis lanthanidiphila TaxID=2211376 RepID=A0A564ZM76_9BACT|nr:mannose-1-phosphate guanyltransferase [Candidatus Methylomirabilis lanthanidiphila]VUZ86196.1 nucleotidyltransferase [Candidatus Methylomirabilis lanthanidiphila]